MLRTYHKRIAALSVMAALSMGSLGLWSASAAASIATSSFQVTATVLKACTVVASPLAFGNYSGTVVTANTTIGVTCTNTTPYNVGLDAGISSGATVTTRAMTLAGGTATLLYGLYQDSALSKNWGNTVGTDTQIGTGNGRLQTLTVYGQIPANQFPTPGAYADTITATVTY